MALNPEFIFFLLIGVVLIVTAAFLLLPNRHRIASLPTIIVAIISLVIGLLFFFLAIRLVSPAY
jgi:high-affinity Fe2+/Pb2+ permease